MVKIKAVIGDKSDESYSKEVEVEISNVDYLIINDRMNICTFDEFDEALHRMCHAIELQNDLPEDWFVDEFDK